MTLRRGNFVLVCDDCDHVEDLDTLDFDDAKEEADRLINEENWTSARRAGEYRHICPTCI